MIYTSTMLPIPILRRLMVHRKRAARGFSDRCPLRWRLIERTLAAKAGVL